MPFGLSAYYEAGWAPDASSYGIGGGARLTHSLPGPQLDWEAQLPRRPHLSRHALPTSLTQDCLKDTLMTCKNTEQCVEEKHGEAGSVICTDGKCLCNDSDSGKFCAVGGVCMKEQCAAGAQELELQIDDLQNRADALKDANGDAVNTESGDQDAAVPHPISRERRVELNNVMAQMAKRTQQAPTFEDLKNELEGNAETLAETASTSLEFQPSVRSLLREMGPVRLESAVQDMTRGVHSVLQFNKSMQPGAIAMMTTSDAKLLNGMDDAVDKALWPIVSLRKVLKSIKGNASLLRGHSDAWAMNQSEEAQDNPGRDVSLPSEEEPKPTSPKQDLEQQIEKDLAGAEDMETGMKMGGGGAKPEVGAQPDVGGEQVVAGKDQEAVGATQEVAGAGKIAQEASSNAGVVKQQSMNGQAFFVLGNQLVDLHRAQLRPRRRRPAPSDFL